VTKKFQRKGGEVGIVIVDVQYMVHRRQVAQIVIFTRLREGAQSNITKRHLEERIETRALAVIIAKTMG
jgi:hypothetical protein